ncbi:MAG: hypothetical protein E6767_00345 [Dysgonomonas sp.]|nr:hypothetical protein [Dysgonomonas sp.]
MKFLDYIKGQRRGRDAHRIEKDSMADPFLYEAIDGFDSIDDDHIKRIDEIRERLSIRTNTTKKRRPLLQAVAAAAVLVLALGGYLMIEWQKADLYARDNTPVIIDVYIPESFYVENIAVIAQHNTEQVKASNVNITKFSIKEHANPSVSEDEIASLSDGMTEDERIMMDIYLPEDLKESNISGEVKPDKPEPLGGYEKYNEYLKRSLRRPTDDACKDRKGKVAVEFSVNSEGQPYLFEVKYSLCGTSDQEAIRLIQSGPKWTQGTERVMVRIEF